MATHSTLARPAGASPLRALIRRYPVTAFLVITFGFAWGLMAPLLLSRQGFSLLPLDLPVPPFQWLASYAGLALPAFLVTAAVGGRAGVMDLLRRSLHWRVGVRWYLIALFGVLGGVLLLALPLFGVPPLVLLAQRWELLLTAFLPAVLMMLVGTNLPEEVAWTGFLQARLQERRGPLTASLLTAPAFALMHLPTYFVDGWIAGMIVEAVSGQPYEAYVQQHIFTPLQMRWSFTSPTVAQGAGLADGHQYWFGQPIPAQLPYPRGLLPAGYLVSSAEDMSRYLLAHLNGGRVGEARILSPEGVAELHRPGFELEPRLWSGLGWGVADLDGVRVLQHSGNTNHFSSELWLLPEAGLGFVLLTNASNQLQSGAVRRLGEGITMLLMGQEPQPVQLSPVPNVVYGVLVGLAGLELLGVARGVRRLWRWRATPPERALVRQIVLPLGAHLLAALLFLGVIPGLLLGGSPANAIFLVPDLGWILALAGAAAAGWGLLRTALALRLMRRPAAPVAGTSPRHA